MKSELNLIHTAETHEDENVAFLAMKELWEKFNSTYGWCMDCDGAVVKKVNVVSQYPM